MLAPHLANLSFLQLELLLLSYPVQQLEYLLSSEWIDLLESHG